VDMKDYLVRKDGGKFSREEYLAKPELYQSVFHEKVQKMKINICILPDAPISFLLIDCTICQCYCQRYLLGRALPKAFDKGSNPYAC
jgi:hypothetical protein